MILDSGARREFPTGAVRDMGGKGRCDLMPLDVIGEWLEDGVLTSIALYMETEEYPALLNALSRFCAKAQWSVSDMCLEVAYHFEEGAAKYGEYNWQKGLPIRCYIDSAVRHYFKFLRRDGDERHDRAFCWNILAAVWTIKHKGEKLFETDKG